MEKYQQLLAQLQEVCKDYPFGSIGYVTLQQSITLIKEAIEIKRHWEDN